MQTNTYRYESVWKSITPEIKQEIIAFWSAEGALPAHENPELRAQQAVVLMRSQDGTIAAVCTCGLRIIPRLRQPLYYYRTFCAQKHRGNHTIVAMLMVAKSTLYEYNKKLNSPESIGIFIELESAQLAKRPLPAYHAQTEFGFLGYSQNQHPIYVHYFHDFQLKPPSLKA